MTFFGECGRKKTTGTLTVAKRHFLTLPKAKQKIHTPFIRSRYGAQNGRCFYCERPIPPQTVIPGETKKGFTDDHFIPLSRGGAKDWSNKVIACPKCNRKKADRMPTEEEHAKFRALNYLNPPTPEVLSPANRKKLCE